MKILFLLFLLIPAIEIYLLIEIGSQVGSIMTILLIIFTALLGAFLVRAQGFFTFAKIQMQLAKGESPALEVMEGIFLFLAGALLLIPGFFTDAIGFLFLVPSLRKVIIAALVRKGVFVRGVGGHPGAHSGVHPGTRAGGGQVYEGTSTKASPDNSAPGRIIDGEFKQSD